MCAHCASPQLGTHFFYNHDFRGKIVKNGNIVAL